MNHGRSWEIVTLVPGFRDPLTVIGIDVIEHAAVEMADLVDHPAGHHFGGAGNIADGEWFDHVPLEVQHALAGNPVMREHPENDRAAAEQGRAEIGQWLDRP